MTRDINVLRIWLLIVVVIAAAAATAVPVLYSRFPWRQYAIGRLFMMKAIAFAVALDVTVLFQFWVPDILVIFWIEAIVFTAIAVTASLMVWLMWRYYKKRTK
jgi:hypothetical protein